MVVEQQEEEEEETSTELWDLGVLKDLQVNIWLMSSFLVRAQV